MMTSKNWFEKCDLCQSQQNSISIAQKYVSEVPPHPWHMVGSDLFYFRRIDFLVVVDYFSKYLFVRKIHNSTSSAVNKELGMIFSEFGKPQIFRSDNGPCYSSQEFKIFMQNWSIEHRTSSPHYPQSNGLAESMVKVSKNLKRQFYKIFLGIDFFWITGALQSPVRFHLQQKFYLEESFDPASQFYHHR